MATQHQPTAGQHTATEPHATAEPHATVPRNTAKGYTMRLLFIFCMVLTSVQAYGGNWMDDFDDGDSINWTDAGMPMKWKESDGLMTSELREQDGYSLLLMGDENWEEYSVVCRVRVANLAGGDWCGIGFSVEPISKLVLCWADLKHR